MRDLTALRDAAGNSGVLIYSCIFQMLKQSSKDEGAPLSSSGVSMSQSIRRFRETLKKLGILVAMDISHGFQGFDASRRLL